MRMGCGEDYTMRKVIVSSQSDKSRRLIWAGQVARMEEGRSTFKILTVKSTGIIPLRRQNRRWEDNIVIDLKDSKPTYFIFQILREYFF